MAKSKFKEISSGSICSEFNISFRIFLETSAYANEVIEQLGPDNYRERERGGGAGGGELGSMNNADSLVDIIDYVGVMLYDASIIIYFI